MLHLEHKSYYEMGTSKGFVPLRPFGPSIGHATLPEQTIKDFNADFEKGASGVDWSPNLVGKVAQEILMSPDALRPHTRFFSDVALHYVGDYAGRHCEPFPEDIKPKVHIQSGWYVSQKEGDFNPVHLHTNTELSCIGYLQMPEGIEEEWAKDDEDHYPCKGHVEFVHGTHSFLGKPTMMVRPKVGDFFIFPGDVMHTVYPFETKGERRSFSMNIFITEKEKDNGIPKEAKS